MKIKDFIKKLECVHQLHGNVNLKFNIPDLMQNNVNVNIWADACRANDFESNNINIDVYKKK